MIQFYSPEIEKTFSLPEEESRHCVRVLRNGIDDEIFVTDGIGNRFRCRIVDPNPKRVIVEICEKEFIDRHWNATITLAVAPTKNMDRMEWLLEKATEIGIDKIVLLRCEHSERRFVKIERLQKIVISAMKQSLKTSVPTLYEMVDFYDFIHSNISGQKFFGYCDSETNRILYTKVLRPNQQVTIIIGPEGDFSPTEAKSAIEAGFIPVSFGDSRLRTETAALFAVEAVHVINQLSV